MRKIIAYVIVLLILVVCCITCQKKRTTQIEPFVSVEVKLNQSRIPINSPLEIDFTWKVLESGKRIDKDYKVLLHFLDKQGYMFLNDDHYPPIACSQWTAGQTVEYQRTIFFSNISTLGIGKIKVGLYEPSGEMVRFPLTGEDEGDDFAYTVAEIEVVGEVLEKEPIYKNGWYEPEYTTRGNRIVEWSWAQQEAEVAFLNPQTDATLYLFAHAPTQELENEQRVILELNGKEIDDFSVTSSEDFIRKITIEKSLWDDKKWADLKIKVDKTFVPSEDGIHGDIRELGIKVYNLYLYY